MNIKIKYIICSNNILSFISSTKIQNNKMTFNFGGSLINVSKFQNLYENVNNQNIIPNINNFNLNTFQLSNDEEFLKECDSTDFGIIKLQPKAQNIREVPLHIMLTIDVSSSMEEQCMWKNKSYSKLDYVKATLKSLFNYLKTQYNEREILISLISFNEEAKVIESFIDIKHKSLSELNNIVESLEADGCTNIYDAFKKASTLYDELSNTIYLNQEFEFYKNVNILLTDGEITSGNDNPILLSEMARSSCIEVQLLGYGEEHDAKLLKQLEKLTQGEYRFVDSFESAGAVYGDVMSGLLHPAWKNIHIQIENGLIYNYHNNKWESSLIIPQIGDECEKIYSCKFNKDVKITITYSDITGYKGLQTNEVISLICNNNDIILEDNVDLRCYMLRQKVLELMYEIFQNSERDSYNNVPLLSNQHMSMWAQTPQRRNRNNRNNIENNENKTEKLLERVDKLTHIIQTFENELNINLTEKIQEVLKDLKDDLSIAKKCLEYKNEATNMYLYSRLASQGGQRAYNLNMNDLLYFNNIHYDNNDSLSQARTVRQQARLSSFASPHAQRVMRDVSQLSQDILTEDSFDMSSSMD